MDSATLNPTEASLSLSGTFLPGDAPERFNQLLDDVWRNRFTTFFALLGEILSLCPEDCEESGFLAAASDIIGLEAAERRALVSHPVFQAWIGLTMRDVNARLTGVAEDSQPLRNRLDGFSSMLDRVREAASNPLRPAFHRLDVDPLIAAVLPPSYRVPDDPAERRAASELGHPLSFFREIAQIALQNIHATWPQAREQFDRLVYAVCYLPGANFRSCSASRYTGVILVSSRDRSLLDLEESLVHEAGHQLLYNIVEVHPITDEGAKGQYRLPWSGQVRDLYGYFHAFFIYVLLAQYHERVLSRPGPARDLAAARLRDIVRSLVTALPDFQTNPDLTPQGHALIDALAREVAELEARHWPLLAS